jgi:hypothetical protein
MFRLVDENPGLRLVCLSAAIVLACAWAALAQTTSFTYQGQLPDSVTPANGTYEIRFTLWDAVAGGTQQPQPAPVVITRSNVEVNARAFTVPALDFGANAFPGAGRYLEISVRRNSRDPFITLSPRQQITATPYAIRSLTAAQADLALNSNKLGGVDAGEYLTMASVGNTVIRNSTAVQAGASFNIDGDGTVGGALQAGAVRAQTARGVYGLTHTDGMTTVGTYVGGSSSGAEGGWFGTQSNDKLFFFTNNGQPTMTVDTTGNVGVGTTTPRATLDVAGNAVQDRDKSGMVKAMLYVDGTLVNPTILRCYNGSTGASTGNCGFTVTRNFDGIYVVNAGFQVSDRFISVAAKPSPPDILGGLPENIGANFGFDLRDNTLVYVYTFFTAGNSLSKTDSTFMLIVY